MAFKSDTEAGGKPAELTQRLIVFTLIHPRCINGGWSVPCRHIRMRRNTQGLLSLNGGVSQQVKV